MTAARAALVDHARVSIARGSKSFRAASRLFGAETRERAWLLYAWCRACDDIIDGQDHGGALSISGETPAQRLTRVEQLTDAALAGRATGVPAFDCLSVVAEECALPRRYIDDVIQGFALDTEDWRPDSERDLMAYCYHVAGAVGCLMAVVMGVAPEDEAVLDRACDLGLAFQLANIARDVAEDTRGGRCYLPQAWLSEAGLREDRLLAPDARPAVIALTARLSALATRFEASARHGTPNLSYRSAWAVLSAAGIYGGIARRVSRDGGGALDRRVSMGRAKKLVWLARSAGESLLRARLYPHTPRPPDLWRRPPPFAFAAALP